MSILINGIPKHGTHALLKAVELLGVPVKYGNHPGAELVHMINEGEPVESKHIFIVRHPKNAFISWMRHYNLPLTSGMLQSRLQNMQEPEGNYLDFCQKFLDWMVCPDTLVIKFEDLISDQATITKITKYLDVPDQPDVIQNLPGHTLTWTGQLSNHETLDAWDDGVETVWKNIGGEYLMETLGYGS